MKKTVLLVFLLLLIPISAITASIADSSIGFGYYTYRQTLKTGSEPYSWNVKCMALSASADITLFGYNSNHGVDFGFSFLYPLSVKVDGYDVETSPADSEWGFRLGAAQKYQMREDLTMVTSLGYQFLMNTRKYKDETPVVHSKAIIHGLFFQGKFIVKLEESLTISVGGLFIVPWFGSVTYSPEGGDSVRSRYSFRGVIINPFLGINLQM